MAKLPIKNDKKPRFINRELSWLDFNTRVLEQGLNKSLPLLERLKFLAIVSSNFDEFFMVRVAALKRAEANGDPITCPSGLSSTEQLKLIWEKVRGMVKSQYDCLLDELFPAMSKEGIVYHPAGSFSEEQESYLFKYFIEEVFPLLTPIRFDPKQSIGTFGNLKVNVVFLLESSETEEQRLFEKDPELRPREDVAVVMIPKVINRIVRVPEDSDAVGFTFLDTLIIQFADKLFPGFKVREHLVTRITRDADFAVDENRDDDFLEAMEQVLTYRERSMVVRMSLSTTSKFLRSLLKKTFELDEQEILDTRNPLALSDLMGIAMLKGFDHLRDDAWKPVDSSDFPQEQSVFDVIAKKDLVLHHPYESYQPVIRLVEEASRDPNVLAIKMTLYRTSGDSPIVAALEQAAQNGKHVSVLVELKARFDEARNITWAERLSNAGVVIVWGIAGLKVHAKALMVIRRESDGIKRYVHFGTGNYNDRTAKLYSDISFFTSREELGYEAGLFFNAITGYSTIPILHRLIMAPHAMKPRIVSLIEREIQKSSPESPGMIKAKMNSLADPDVIEALYRASCAGVRIELNIRGICMLIPGVPGMSEHIKVNGIIDRYLEHARVYCFNNGGQTELWCGSADWMNRNLSGRVELMFPIDNEGLKEQILANLDVCLGDNQNSWDLGSDGMWTRRVAPAGTRATRAQLELYKAAKNKNKEDDEPDKKVFNVRRNPKGGKS